MSRQLNETVLSNSKLTEELLAARATVEKLQKEVRDFRAFCKSCSHEGSDVTSQQRSRGMNVAPDLLPTHQLLPADSELPLTANLSSCHVCSEVQKASKLNGTVAPHLYKHDAITLCTSDNMLVNLGDSILTFSNHCGTVRYIGHLDGFAPTCLFVGVQLADRVSGGLDGTWNGKRYFSCPNGRGIFIQPQDIVNVLSKKQASVIHKSKKPSKSRNAVVDSPPSSSSSRSAGAGGLVSKLRKAAVGIKHTYSQKRISLPDSTSSVDAVLPPECRQSKRQVDNHTNSTSTTPQY
ncbi:hypothetical protein EB796_019637 [Bugula neritina]|uniref:CAP-Gly domain-containing protein n=1 Tax=Bugula neritina TaxID=10212 RepID=A0A7J7J7C9_BUGNE|nr:hypothetical protein EB796_019637 [Bugula neritina]